MKKSVGAVILHRRKLEKSVSLSQVWARVAQLESVTVNVIRNQQRNHRTLDETSIGSPQVYNIYSFNSSVCPSRAGTGRGGEASLDIIVTITHNSNYHIIRNFSKSMGTIIV